MCYITFDYLDILPNYDGPPQYMICSPHMRSSLYEVSPLYEESPPYYDDDIREDNQEIITIINNIQNNNNLGYLILDENTPSPSNILKYLAKNYSQSHNMKLYMINNKDKDNNVIKIGEHNKVLKTKQDKIFILGLINLKIVINKTVHNYSEYKSGVFIAIFIKPDIKYSAAIHCINTFYEKAISTNKYINFDTFLTLF